MCEPANIIVTKRLILRTPMQADLPLLHAHILSDALVMRHALAGEPMTSSRAREFMDGDFDHEGSGRKLGVLVERTTEQVIGFAGLLECNVLDAADFELGFVLRRSAWGQGYATEIGRGQIEFGFHTLGLKRVLALASPENSASICVLRKIGMQLHSTVRTCHRGERQVFLIQGY